MSNPWWSYVKDLAPTASQREVAAAVDVSESTVSRWRSGTLLPTPHLAVAFARAYGATAAEGLFRAGFLSEYDPELLGSETVHVPSPVRVALDGYTDVELLDELRSRALSRGA